MKNIIFCTYGHTPATLYTEDNLKKYGYSFSDYANCTHLLLPVPSLLSDGTVRGAGPLPTTDEKHIPIGGNIDLPNGIDLLKDPFYVAGNAMVTAHCAIKVALRELTSVLTENRILIIGWGRIGKCLAQLLKNIGCSVTVAARKDTDRAMLSSLGYFATDITSIIPDDYDIIFNTVPVLLIENCESEALIIDLASKPGITGKNIITARGLPAIEAPQSSGRLIAESIHRILQNKEACI